MNAAKIGFVGAGQMATALAQGFVQQGAVPAEHICGYSPTEESRARFEQATGGTAKQSNAEVLAAADIIFLAIKPQLALDVFRSLDSDRVQHKLFVSVIAGMRAATIAEALNTQRVIRVLPTTPCLIGQGIAAISALGAVSDDELTQVEELLATVATTYRMQESALDGVTGMANPAYVLQFIEALADGGVLVGLPRAVAQDLAARNVLGAAAMMLETGEHPAVLRDRVTSPGGTTIAGLRTLEDGGLRGTVIKAVEASTQRSRELGAS